MITSGHEVSRFELMLVEGAGAPAFRGIDLFAKIYRNVENIRRVLTDSGRMEVLTLGRPDDNYLAGILLENPWIADHSVSNDLATVSERLRAVLTDENTTADDFVAPLRPYDSKLSDEGGTGEHRGLLIVADQDLIARLSQKEGVDFDEGVNLGPVALNHFSIDLTSG